MALRQKALIESVIDEYIKWLGDVTQSLFFTRDDLPELPQSFERWLENEANKPSLPSEVMGELERSYQILKQTACSHVSRPPSQEAYSAIVTAHNHFLQYVMRLYKGGVDADAGIDILTGLRKPDRLEEDVQREQERFVRHGKAFVLAYLRVNDFSSLVAQGQGMTSFQYLADMVKKNLRSFDDAYAMGHGGIVLVLKQTGIAGGKRMLRRLREGMEKGIEAEKQVAATLSFTATTVEPSPKDDIVQLLDHLRADLNEHNSHTTLILEYQPLSPLQHYIKNNGCA